MAEKKINYSYRIKELCFSITNGLLKNEQDTVFKELASSYLNMSYNEKKLLADSLQSAHILSKEIVNLIIYDKAEIAEMFLINSPLLNDEKLISFIDDNHDLIKLRYIAKRNDLSENLKNKLLKIGDKTIHKLINNKNIDQTLLVSFQVKNTVTNKGSSAQKKHFELNIQNLELNEIKNSVHFKKIKNNLDLITSKSQPNYTFLIKYLCKGAPLSFLYLLGKKSDTSFSIILENFVKKYDKDRALFFIKKAHIPYKFAIAVSEVWDIVIMGLKEQKITASNIKNYLLTNVKNIKKPEISREISYIEKMI